MADMPLDQIKSGLEHALREPEICVEYSPYFMAALKQLRKSADELERLRAALTVARKFVNDHGPEEPGDQSRKTNDMLALIDDALTNG